MQASITKAQIKAIHVALARQGIEDDVYREKLRLMFDVGTCKALSRQQATTLLKSLGLAVPKPARQARSRRASTARVQGDNIIALPTPAQMQFIGDLRREIVWDQADGYQCWLRCYLGINRIRTRAEAARVIEGLKGVKQSQQAGINRKRRRGED